MSIFTQPINIDVFTWSFNMAKIYDLAGSGGVGGHPTDYHIFTTKIS